MKTLLVIVSLLFFFALSVPSVDARVRVGGYYKRSTGTYVQPHYRTSPDSSRFNNYSTRGNVNPYTGKMGYTNPHRSFWR